MHERSVRPRRRFLAALAGVPLLAALVAGCGGAATQAPAPSAGQGANASQGAQGGLVSVKVSQPVTSLSQMTLYVGLGRGYFRQQGLDVQIVAFNGGGPDTAALLKGDVQFDWTPDSYFIDLLAAGKKALNVFNDQNKSIITWAMSKAVAQRLGITNQTPLDQRLKALKGLTIGITTPGALTDKLARYYVKRAGLDPDKDVRIIGVGSGNEAVAALQNGKVDVLVVSVPQPELAVQRGIAIEFLGVGEDPQLNDFLMNSVHVMPSYAQQHPDVVRKFVAAARQASQWEQTASPEEIASAIEPYLKGYDHALLVAGVTQVKKALNPTGEVSRAAADNTVAVVGTPGVTGDQLFAEFDGQYLR
jgi:NitT/TauT family transport system substrate-binding protein